MSREQPKNPLHGLTLENILTQLVEHYGWERLGDKIRIACFTNDPSIKSSLTFLRRNLWAREQVEQMFIRLQARREQSARSNPKLRPED